MAVAIRLAVAVLPYLARSPSRTEPTVQQNQGDILILGSKTKVFSSSHHYSSIAHEDILALFGKVLKVTFAVYEMESGVYEMESSVYELEMFVYEMETISTLYYWRATYTHCVRISCSPEKSTKVITIAPFGGRWRTNFRGDGDSHQTTSSHRLFSHVIARPQEMLLAAWRLKGT